MLCCLVYCGYSSVNTVILTPTLLVPTGTVKLIFVITSWPSPFEVALKVALAPSAARVAERADGVISVVPISRGGGGGGKVGVGWWAARVAERADGVISVVPISRGGGGVPSCVT